MKGVVTYYQDADAPAAHAWRWRCGDRVSERVFKTRRGAVDDYQKMMLKEGYR